ncbi:4-hydroxyphenylpyruvate dioxygenase-like protein isoform X2 [Protopterus annectens]|uniref:4-hydroxyphenylpyruvate dioxygenase-like protein isoform X2 n=1 Tax=Protopterus annectens TaxID=7888 RepID=UPI001CFBF400|nr:4-hydroxyphenylpyruvate dioxygenase-like protein isoform X2 [Protopterus annectens]
MFIGPSMIAAIKRVNHITFHVTDGEQLVTDLVSKFRCTLFATRVTKKVKQLVFRKGSSVFVVNQKVRVSSSSQGYEGHSLEMRPDYVGSAGVPNQEWVHNWDGHFLYDAEPSGAISTASNLSFEVDNLNALSRHLRDSGCNLLVPPTKVEDDSGFVLYSVVKSIVGNVCHTLIDKAAYRGEFLPGFLLLDRGRIRDDDTIGHIDHVTYACPRGSTPHVLDWYEKCFGFKRFYINRNEDVREGLVITGNGIGLRLTAMQYWNCSEAGMDPSATKVVIAESLPQQGNNQVDTFLNQHGSAGIQHVGLYTRDIITASKIFTDAGVQFLCPPHTYYTEIGKLQEIQEAGHDPNVLWQQGVLLDAEVEGEEPHEDEAKCKTACVSKKRS